MRGRHSDSKTPDFDHLDKWFERRLFCLPPGPLRDDAKNYAFEILEAAGMSAALDFIFITVPAITQDAGRLFGFGEQGITKLADKIVSRLTDRWLMLSNDRGIHLANSEIRTRGERVCRKIGIRPPAEKKPDDAVARRFLDRTWWKRVMRYALYPQREQVARDIGLVREYSSRAGRQTRRAMLRRQAEFISAAAAREKATGREIPLEQLAKAKAEGEQARLVAKATGLIKYADEQGWQSAMLTITCPGEFRRDGTTIAEALDYLRQVWARVRAAAHRKGLRVAGAGVFQPHRDGFPHLHDFVIGPPEDLAEFVEIVREHALREYPDEPGAVEHRVDVRYEDRRKGRLSSYLLRYVVREYARPSEPTANDRSGSAVDAWYAMHHARRIFWHGLPPDLWWESHRRCTRKQAQSRRVRRLRKVARAGDYCRWLDEMGGITGSSRRDRDTVTLHDVRENKYEEAVKVPVGVITDGVEILIRKEWEIVLRTVIVNGPRDDLSSANDDVLAVPDATGPPMQAIA